MAKTDKERIGMFEDKKKKTHLGWFMHSQKKLGEVQNAGGSNTMIKKIEWKSMKKFFVYLNIC